MNKQLIITYFEEFEHWLNGGNVQVYYKKDDEPKWLTDEECIEYEGHDNFSHIIRNSLEPEDVLIIIDDEYIEFRKALAEGNTIQYYECIYQHEMDVNLNRYDWLDWKSATPSSSFTKTLKYRIKPEEPKFKVGNWVVNKESKQRIIKKVTSVYSDTVTVGDSTVGINVMLIKDLELWEPKEGDICWFWNKSNIYPRLATFINESLGSYYADTSNDGFDFCEPFIGQLPSYLKE